MGGERGADGGCGRTPVPAELSQLSVVTLIPAQQAPEASALRALYLILPCISHLFYTYVQHRAARLWSK